MDVTRIPLRNTVFEGQNNVYLIDGEVTTVVDVGIEMDGVRSDLLDGLAAAGVSPPDIDQILLTHWHPDHSGLAGDLQERSGAPVYVHEDDAPLVAGDEDAAVGTVAGLAEDLGFEPVLAGDLEAAGHLESLARFWIELSQAYSRDIGFRLLRG